MQDAEDERCVALVRLNGDQCPDVADWQTTQGKRLCHYHAFLVSNLGVTSLPLFTLAAHNDGSPS